MYKFSSLKLINFFRVFLIVLILLFFQLSTPHSYAIQPTYGNWTFAGLSNSQISRLAVDPSNSNVLYAGTTNNGIFKSTDHGTNWSAVNNGLPSLQNLNVGGLAVDPSNSNVLYAGSNGSGGVFKSTDGGATWIDTTNGISNPLITSIVIDPTNSNIIYVAANQVWKSTDGGATWVNTNAPFNPAIIVLDPTNPNIIYVGGGASISKSIDGGANWTATDPSIFGNNEPGSTGILSLTIDPTSPNILYTSVLPARAEPGVFKSIDGGVTWTLLSPNTFDSTSITGCNIYFLVSDPEISGTLYASGSGCRTFRIAPIYKSTDGGVTWNAINYNGFPWFPSPNAVGILISKYDSNVLYGFPSASSLGLYMYGLNPNSAPIVQMPGNSSINEGVTYSASGSFTDPDSTSWTGTVDYGDGGGTQSLFLNSDKTFSLSHQYKDNGTYTVTVNVTDNQGATGTGTATVTVNNVTPTVGAITVATSPVQVNSSITASASFTDPGVLDTHTASWNWGDGNTTTGTVTESNGSGSVSNTHTYTASGVYPVTLTVTDNHGGTGTATYQYVVVYDASAGWVNGNKEFTSPAGAVTGNTSATGKASFGFQVKYTNGSMVPSGKNVSLSFPTGNINFASTSYQWLVINGSQATFKANGTFNGVSGYTVLVSAIQGSGNASDLVRFQIKDSGGNVVYDTQPGAADTTAPTTAVTKGKITIH